MSSKEVIQHRASSLLIIIGTGIALFLVLAANALDISVRHDATTGAKTAPIIEDWKGNSGTIPYKPAIPSPLQKNILR